jgi:rubrerythrin
VLKVTPAAVTQYTKGRRGNKLGRNQSHQQIIDALAEKAAQRIRSGTGSLELVELLDSAYQLLAASKGQRTLDTKLRSSARNEWMTILKDRLRLELNAAQKCLAIANRAHDEHSKLLMRMIASDSVRHADIVSQLMSWLETGHKLVFDPPDRAFVREMLVIEDKASESSLAKSIKLPPSVARLLLESIDMDEAKHERLLGRMLEIIGPTREGLSEAGRAVN